MHSQDFIEYFYCRKMYFVNIMKTWVFSTLPPGVQCFILLLVTCTPFLIIYLLYLLLQVPFENSKKRKRLSTFERMKKIQLEKERNNIRESWANFKLKLEEVQSKISILSIISSETIIEFIVYIQTSSLLKKIGHSILLFMDISKLLLFYPL